MSSPTEALFQWPSRLREGRLVRRYERFVAEIELPNEGLVRAHCVNPGRMEGLISPGARVWVSRAEGERALRYTWELIELDGKLIGVNTSLPNRLARSVVERRLISGFEKAGQWKAEQRFGRGHRVDLLARGSEGEHFVEVKNCHLVYPDLRGYFPDSRSERAQKHVEALARQVKGGKKATVLFTVQRGDAKSVRPSDLHDREFALAVRRAARSGVAFRAVCLEPTTEGINLVKEIPVELEPYPVNEVADFCRTFETTSGWVRKDGKVAGARI